MTLVASISSSKGGSGKSTTSINLGVALANLGRDVTVIDSNLSTPNLSMYLGAPSLPVTLHHVLSGNAKIADATYTHDSGAKIVPGSLSMRNFEKLKLEDLRHHLHEVKSDVVILDGAAGIDKEAQDSIRLAHQILVVTNPELPAVADALKTVRIAQKFDVPVRGVVLTRAGHRLDLKVKNVETILEHPVIGVIPEDVFIKKALIQREPVVHAFPNAPASRAYSALGKFLMGHEFNPEQIGKFFRFMKWSFGVK
jgi:septum site-determining protein MinD|tara:strand:- start:45015 stop:45776 length:762 start_codon:yes stop_codon:yes gene_type:complete